MKLAAHMRRVNVDDMLEDLTPGQFNEWRAADELDQLLGGEKLYQILSLIGSASVNSWGGKTNPSQFIPPSPAETKAKQQEQADERRPAGPNQMAALFLLAAHNLRPHS